METLNITKEAALKAYQESNAKQRLLLENLFGKRTFQKDIFERITTLKDVFEELGEDMEAFFKKNEGEDEDDIYYKVCKKICRAFNGEWEAKFDGIQENWFIWWDLSSGKARLDRVYYYRSYAGCSSRLCLKDQKMAEHVAKYFSEEFNKHLNK